MAQKTYHGSCHCGAITYEADIDLSQGTSKCNCTFCRKARSWKAFATAEQFRLLTGQDAMVAYRSNEQTLNKYHCKTCGMRTHEHGFPAWKGGAESYGIYLCTIDDINEDELANAPVHISDGLHNNWMETPADVRNL